MFRVSTKGDYGLLLMTSLAERSERSFVSLKKIADEKHLSLSYISQLILSLKNAGLVQSKEGLNGGYRLAKSAEKISLLEILQALEGDIIPVKCCNQKNDPCNSEDVCGVQSTWREATEVLRKYFSSRKLSDLVSKTTGSPINFL